MEESNNIDGRSSAKIDDYYIYRVILSTDGRTYIGKRKVRLWYTPAEGMNDYTPGEYYGSSDHIKNALKLYGVENFTREVIDEYHDITKLEIGIIESAYIKAEWTAGHGEFNYSANSHGGDIFDGMPDEIRSEVITKISASAQKQVAEGKHPFQLIPYEKRLEMVNNIPKILGPDGLSARAKKGNDTLGPEGRSKRAKKAIETIGPEGLKERARKASITRDKNGTHPWKDHYKLYTDEQRHERALKGACTLGFEGRSEISKRSAAKSNETKKVEWIFYNPTINIYKIHVSAWTHRIKKGFTERICKYSDWPQYKLDHKLDVEPIR